MGEKCMISPILQVNVGRAFRSVNDRALVWEDAKSRTATPTVTRYQGAHAFSEMKIIPLQDFVRSDFVRNKTSLCVGKFKQK